MAMPLKLCMNDAQVTQLVPVEQVERLIHLARGEKVLLDADLAMLYGVTTGARSIAPSDVTPTASLPTSCSN